MAWAPDYITSAELKAFLQISSAADDVQVAAAVTAASRAIDRHTNRQFGVVAAAEERFYTGCWDRRRARWVLDVDDFQSITGLVVSINGTAVTTFVKEPRNNAVKGRPWERLVFDEGSTTVPTGKLDEVSVTALWGWTAVPTAVKEACYLQGSRFFARRSSPYGVAGSPDLGSEIRLLNRVDVDVAVSLGSYLRWWTAA